ncbi:MAG: hypothetical protein KDK55_05200 [Chlamydiia bacterium]|nr:hypothetical protein [Chlamydiia bacterium]
MEIWLDGYDLKLLEKIKELNLVHGVTTNPSIIARAGGSRAHILSTLLDFQHGPLAVQIVATNAEEIIEEAKALYGFSSRIIVKIPATMPGYQAIYRLSRARIPTMATAIVDPLQALLAAKVGADYLALYLSSAGDNLLSVLPQIVKKENPVCKILGASIHKKEEISSLLEKLDGVTLSPAILKEILETPLAAAQALAKFDYDVSIRACLKSF